MRIANANAASWYSSLQRLIGVSCRRARIRRACGRGIPASLSREYTFHPAPMRHWLSRNWYLPCALDTGFCARGLPRDSRFTTHARNGSHAVGMRPAIATMRAEVLAGCSLGIIIDIANTRFSIIRGPITRGRGTAHNGRKSRNRTGSTPCNLAWEHDLVHDHRVFSVCRPSRPRRPWPWLNVGLSGRRAATSTPSCGSRPTATRTNITRRYASAAPAT